MKVLKTASVVHTVLMYVSFCLSARTSVSIRRSRLQNVSYDFVLNSPAVPSMSCLSYLDGLLDRRSVIVLLLFCDVLLPGCVYARVYVCV